MILRYILSFEEIEVNNSIHHMGSQISAHVLYTIFLATRSKVREQLHVCIGLYRGRRYQIHL